VEKMSRQMRIKEKLLNNFDVDRLDVIDESESHRGHAGFQEGGESHFRVCLVSVDFEGLSRIARHRAVHDAVGKELLAEVHALALDLSTP